MTTRSACPNASRTEATQGSAPHRPTRHPPRPLLPTLWALTLLIASCAPKALTITFLDVGQGDAVLIQTPAGQTVLVDAGAADPVTKLRALGVEQIDLLVASHPHADHIGGMDEILESFPVRAYLDNGVGNATQTYAHYMATIEARPDLTYLAPEPRSITLGETSIEVLDGYTSRTHLNNGSLALVIRYGRFSVLLTGDAETPALAHLTHSGAVPDVTVLKASHHGSDNGFTDSLLIVARPDVVVISVGGNNSFGHPGARALSAYWSVAAQVYRTDLHGSVTIRGFQDGDYRVFTER